MSVETTLNGKYLLTKQIGAGAFGEVYVATDLTLKREVAVKLLKPFPDPNYEERFLSEARLTSQLTHAHTLTVYDFGQHEQRLYLVTELLKGESLRDHLTRVGRLSPQRVTELFVPICSALEEAHQMGIIHRDLKPDNLFLHRAFDGERLILLDFGIAKSLVDVTLTQTGQIFGTPHYMAPEQIRETKNVGAPADLYSLGVILFECLTGTQPYQGESLYDIFQGHIATPIPKVSELGDHGLSLFETLIQQLLAKDPSGRPQSARAVGVSLMALVRKLEEASAHAEGTLDELDATLDGNDPAVSAPLYLNMTLDSLTATMEPTASGVTTDTPQPPTSGEPRDEPPPEVERLTPQVEERLSEPKPEVKTTPHSASNVLIWVGVAVASGLGGALLSGAWRSTPAPSAIEAQGVEAQGAEAPEQASALAEPALKTTPEATVEPDLKPLEPVAEPVAEPDPKTPDPTAQVEAKPPSAQLTPKRSTARSKPARRKGRRKGQRTLARTRQPRSPQIKLKRSKAHFKPGSKTPLLLRFQSGQVRGGELSVRFSPKGLGTCKPNRKVTYQQAYQTLCTVNWRGTTQSGTVSVCLRGGECAKQEGLIVEDLSTIDF